MRFLIDEQLQRIALGHTLRKIVYPAFGVIGQRPKRL